MTEIQLDLEDIEADARDTLSTYIPAGRGKHVPGSGGYTAAAQHALDLLAVIEEVRRLQAQIEAMTPDYELGRLTRLWSEQRDGLICGEADGRFYVRLGFGISHAWHSDLKAALCEALGERDGASE